MNRSWTYIFVFDLFPYRIELVFKKRRKNLIVLRVLIVFQEISNDTGLVCVHKNIHRSKLNKPKCPVSIKFPIPKNNWKVVGGNSHFNSYSNYQGVKMVAVYGAKISDYRAANLSLDFALKAKSLEYITTRASSLKHIN